MEIAQYLQIVILFVVWVYLGRIYREIVRIRETLEANRENRGKES